MIGEIVMKRFKKMFVLLIMFVVLLNYANEGVFIQAKGESHELLSKETDGEFVIEKYAISDNALSPLTTTKEKDFGFVVKRDNVICFELRHKVKYAYGIPTANGDYAQIISYSAYVSYTNSSSAYYPDTSQKKDTLVKFGNPAKLTTTIPIRKKSNDSIVDTPKLVSKFYGTGKAE